MVKCYQKFQKAMDIVSLVAIIKTEAKEALIHLNREQTYGKTYK